MIRIPAGKKGDECEAEINGPLFDPFLAHVPISGLLSSQYYTQSVPDILLESARLLWGMTQYFGC